MKAGTTKDVLEILHAPIDSAALGAAMELGLFWLLDAEPMPSAEVARTVGIPLNRCQPWLEILCRLGLLEVSAQGYGSSAIARKAILETLSRETWAFQAREYRQSLWFVRDLALNIGRPISGWQPEGAMPRHYFQQIQADPEHARLFTRKLYEIHLSLAKEVAGLLDLRGVVSALDLGGGSGVVSFALLRKKPDLNSVVMDVENVCRAGRELAVQHHLEDRVKYLSTDFLQDELPTGFDLVLLCDVGAFDEDLFRRIRAALNPGGRLVIVDKFSLDGTTPPPSRLSSVFIGALVHPAQSIDYMTIKDVQIRLQQAGFRDPTITSVPHTDDLPWNLDWTLLEAQS